MIDMFTWSHYAGSEFCLHRGPGPASTRGDGQGARVACHFPKEELRVVEAHGHPHLYPHPHRHCRNPHPGVRRVEHP